MSAPRCLNPEPSCVGLVASAALLIEKKARRAELALYTLPRAADSLMLALMQRRWVPSLPFGALQYSGRRAKSMQRTPILDFGDLVYPLDR